jgi:hypothetical protein
MQPGNIVMPESLLVAAPLMIAAIVMAVRFVGCGIDDSPLPGDPGTTGDDNDNPKPVKVSASFTGSGNFSATAGFPNPGEDSTPYSGAGTHSYPIPYWCDTIDLVLLGAGGGGTYAEFNPGDGGGAGGWKAITIQRGSDIPWATTTITITVGQGGTGGSLATPTGGTGGDTTASWDTSSGTTTETAHGGAGGANTGDPTGESPSPSQKSAGDAMLSAGSEQPTTGAIGNPPGGGGAGSGNGLQNGGAGADGAAVVVARQQN